MALRQERGLQRFDSADAEGTAGAAGSGTALPEAGAVHV